MKVIKGFQLQISETDFVSLLLDCGNLTLNDGDITYTNGTVYNSEASLTCHEGYDLLPDTLTTATCLSNGSWSNDEPNCQIKDNYNFINKFVKF